MRPPTLSAVMIVRNEEANLRELVRYWPDFDEVILVDGGSSDRSVDVCRRAGVTVFQRPFDNFAAQRNFAIAQATGQWLLSFDADERPTPAMMQEVGQQIAEGCADAYRVPIRSTIFGRPFRFSGTQNDRPVRLFRRGSACWLGDVHEVLSVRGRTARLRHGLDHHTLPDLSAFLAKMHRYTELEAVARVAVGRAPKRHATWTAPLVEFFRRLIWKHGWLDGPHGWAFCALSGLSAHVLAARHRELWDDAWRATTGATSDVPIGVRSMVAELPSPLLSARA